MFKSAETPTAVFWLPVLFNKRAAAPTAVLLFAGTQSQRSRPDTGVEAGIRVAKERKPAKCGVSRAGGDVKKGIVPVCRVEPG